jgi:hypothetical protein
MRVQKLGHLYNGTQSQLSGIICSNHFSALVLSTPRTKCLKNKATAVLLLGEPILRSMAKRHLSLYEHIIPYSLLWVQVVCLTDKVSLFSGKGDFLLCPHPP